MVLDGEEVLEFEIHVDFSKFECSNIWDLFWIHQV